MIKIYTEKSEDELRKEYKATSRKNGIKAIGRDNNGGRIKYVTAHKPKKFAETVKTLAHIVLSDKPTVN